MLDNVLISIANGSSRCSYCGEILYAKHHMCDEMKAEIQDNPESIDPE